MTRFGIRMCVWLASELVPYGMSDKDKAELAAEWERMPMFQDTPAEVMLGWIGQAFADRAIEKAEQAINHYRSKTLEPSEKIDETLSKLFGDTDETQKQPSKA